MCSVKIGVVGGGIFGIAAALALRERDHAVAVFDQGPVPHPHASSTDVAKAIRRTSYAGANETYVELVERAAHQWRSWQTRFGTTVYHRTGGLTILPSFAPGSPMYESWRFLQARGATDAEVLSAPEIRARFPQFTVRDDEVGFYDGWRGYLESGRAVAQLARLVRAEGVQIHDETPVLRVEEGAEGGRVVVEHGAHAFDRVVVAAGAWVGRLLPQIGRHVEVTRQQMVFIEVENPSRFAGGTMPVWSIEPDTAGWYGFPLLREGYVKVSKDPRGEIVDPDVDRSSTPEFVEQAMAFLHERIPEMAAGKVVGSRSCLYANTPDDHFVIDWVPGSQRILVAGGGSGHGFKFGGSIGAVIADAVEDKDNPLGRLFRIGERLRATDRRQPGMTRGFAQPLSTSPPSLQ